MPRAPTPAVGRVAIITQTTPTKKVGWLCLVFSLDPHTRHYPDGDAKKRLNNSSSMPEILGKRQTPLRLRSQAPVLGLFRIICQTATPMSIKAISVNKMKVYPRNHHRTETKMPTAAQITNVFSPRISP